MSAKPANFRQQDVTRAINAAKRAGLSIARVEVDPKTAKISVIIAGTNEEPTAKPINPFDTAPSPVPDKRPFADAPVHDSMLRRRKPKSRTDGETKA
jgi:hypothetical protein